MPGDIGLKFKVVKTGTLNTGKLKLSAAQYRELGEAMLRAQKKRITQGINAEGRPARPLSRKYAAIKAAALHRRNVFRDMTLTGLTLDSFRLERASGGVIRARPQGAEAQKRATFSEYREQMIGFTDAEEKAVTARANALLGRNVSEAWEPTS